MGFKCPMCKEDFGTDKVLWQIHLQGCQNGVAEAFVKAIISTCEAIPKEVSEEQNDNSIN